MIQLPDQQRSKCPSLVTGISHAPRRTSLSTCHRTIQPEQRRMYANRVRRGCKSQLGPCVKVTARFARAKAARVEYVTSVTRDALFNFTSYSLQSLLGEDSYNITVIGSGYC